MPQPTKANSFSWGLPVLLARPECLAGIGLVAAQWSEVEANLAELYMHAHAEFVYWPGDGDSDGAGTGKVNHNHLTVFSAVESLRARLAMIASMLIARGSKDLVASFDVLSGEIRRRARERATVVHGRWGTSHSHPSGLVLVPPTGGKMIWYTEADFRQIAERISETSSKIMEFTSACGDEFRRPADPRIVKYFKELGSSVERRGGEYFLKGTDVSVDVVGELKLTRSDEQIIEAYPDLTLDQIQTAVDYVQAYPRAIRQTEVE